MELGTDIHVRTTPNVWTRQYILAFLPPVHVWTSAKQGKDTLTTAQNWCCGTSGWKCYKIMKICNLEPNSPSLTQSFLGSRCVTTSHSHRYLLVSPTWVHWIVFHSKTYENKGSTTKHTYRFIFSALWPVEPFHHCAGCHLFPLHAGDAE